MSDKTLVIGATSNVGRYLVKLLADKGERVRAATRALDKYPRLDNVEPVSFDYDKRETFAPVLDGVNRAFITVRGAEPNPDVLVNPFIDKAKEAGVGHIVLMTAMGIDQAPDEAGYRKLELYLMNAGVDYTILRPNWFMQNFNPGIFLQSIQRDGGVFIPAGDGTSSMIDTRDIAAVAAVALAEEEHKGKGYTLTGSQALGYAEAVAVISEVAGREIKYVAISEKDFQAALEQMGMSSEQVEMMSYLYHAVRQGWTAPIAPTVPEILGREPITFEQFARENAGAWK
jgi:uncharacterized protein YbjT (DUF2867 family)